MRLQTLDKKRPLGQKSPKQDRSLEAITPSPGRPHTVKKVHSVSRRTSSRSATDRTPEPRLVFAAYGLYAAPSGLLVMCTKPVCLGAAANAEHDTSSKPVGTAVALMSKM